MHKVIKKEKLHNRSMKNKDRISYRLDFIHQDGTRFSFGNISTIGDVLLIQNQDHRDTIINALQEIALFDPNAVGIVTDAPRWVSHKIYPHSLHVQVNLLDLEEA